MSEQNGAPTQPSGGQKLSLEKRAKEYSSGTNTNHIGDKHYRDQNERETLRHHMGSHAIADKLRGRPIKTVWVIKAIVDNNQ